MEKISRIIAPSARTKNYDVARALPVRPGAPSIGRPESMKVLDDRMTLSDQLVDPILNGDTVPSGKSLDTYKPRDSGIKSQVIKELTNKFFAKENPKSVARDSAQTHSEEIVSQAQSSAGSSVNPDSSSDVNL
jgi:hypothetical protein